MENCQCITQQIAIRRWKKDKDMTWKDKFPMFGMGGLKGEMHLTIHANDIDDLKKKKDELKSQTEKQYPEQDVTVVALFD